MNTKLVAVLGPAILIAACGNPKNSSLPPTVEALKKSTPKEGGNKLWSDLATALGIGDNRAATGDALKAELATPPMVLNGTAEGAAAFTKLTNEVLAPAYAAEAYKSRCAQVESVTKLGAAVKIENGIATALANPTGASYYLMKFKLAADIDGTPATSSSYGYLTIPEAQTATNISPLVAYAHAGMAGLSYYSDVAALFGDLQLNHIIAAPAFPGEKVCKAGFNTASTDCDAQGTAAEDAATRAPFTGDSDVVLGMQDCLVRALYAESQSGATGDALQAALSPLLTDAAGTSLGFRLGQKIGLAYKPHTGTTAPVSYIVGTDHGGLTLHLALAKAGAAAGAISAANQAANAAGQKPLGAFYGSNPPAFSCAASIAAPASITFGEYRLALEQSSFGFFDKSPMAQLPFPRVFDAGVMAMYRAGSLTAAQAALEIQKRDALFNMGLAAGALMNWGTFLQDGTTLSPGAMLYMHGTEDAVVFPSQAAVISKTMEGVQASLRGTIGGVNVTALGVKPSSDHPVDLANGVYGHLADAAFLKGTVLNTTESAALAIPLTSTPAIQANLDAALANGFTAGGNSLGTAVATWLGTPSQAGGCGFSTFP